MRQTKNNLYIDDTHDLTIIPLENLFEGIQLEFLNSYYSIYQIEDEAWIAKKMNTDFKMLFTHHLIYEMCQYLIHNKFQTRHRIILVEPIDSKYEIFKRWPNLDINKIIAKTLNTVKHRLPFPVYISDAVLDFKGDSGECVEEVHKMLNIVQRYAEKNITLQDLKRFSEKSGLKYLSEQYYKTGKFMSLLYKN